MRPVNSSNVEAIGNSPDGFFVKFKSGTYVYRGVPPEVLTELDEVHAKKGSVGSFISNKIVPRIRDFQRMPEEKKP